MLSTQAHNLYSARINESGHITSPRPIKGNSTM